MDFERSAEPQQEFHALETDESEIAFEMRRGYDRSGRLRAAQFDEQLAENIGDLRFDDGAVNVRRGCDACGHGLLYSPQAITASGEKKSILKP